MPIFNNNKSKAGHLPTKMALKNTEIIVESNVNYAVYTEDELYLDNCELNAAVALSTDSSTPKAYVTSGTYTIVSYFDEYTVVEPTTENPYYTVVIK